MKLSGILVDICEPVAIADALSGLCNNFEKRKLFGTKARTKVLSDYTVGRQVDECKTVYLKQVKQKTISKSDVFIQ